MPKPTPLNCPCGRPRPYAECCGPLHAGAPAADAEALMRSRYTAYVLGDTAYLLASWHPASRPTELNLDAEPKPKWLGLTIVRHEILDTGYAVVEFIARYKIHGRAQRMHETSRFEQLDGHWLYRDGEIEADQ